MTTEKTAPEPLGAELYGDERYGYLGPALQIISTGDPDAEPIDFSPLVAGPDEGDVQDSD